MAVSPFWTTESAPMLRAVDAGQCPVLVSGAGAATRAHLAAALQKNLAAPLFVVCPDDSAAEVFQRDLEALLREPVTLLQSREFTFYSADSASRSAEQKRLAALDALAREAAPVTVCTAAALLQRSIPKQKLLSAAFDIADGQEISIEAVENSLLNCGYVHRLQVDGPGQYSRRGGILDIFSPALSNPVRMEFWGDEIDSMGTFDLNSQRRIENIPSCRILPAAETLPQLFAGGETALADLLDEEAVKAAKSRSEEKHKLAANLRADAEKLREKLPLPAADRYMGFIYTEFTCALE